jgi:hypothetical protein
MAARRKAGLEIAMAWTEIPEQLKKHKHLTRDADE